MNAATLTPQPSAAAHAHSQTLQQLIRDTINTQQGAITFAQYMALALYHPGLGYYSAGCQKFGHAGDFVTAPEISSLFAATIARSAATVLTATQGNILELGAGSGKMTVDLLTALAACGTLPQHYFILEPSPDLRERQRHHCQRNSPQLYSRISWLTSPPRSFKGLIFANEVLDALPVHCFNLSATGLQERMVTTTTSGFAWRNQAPSSTQLTQAVAQLPLHNVSPGYQSEINLQLPALLTSLNDCLQHGVMVFIDYGFLESTYYHPDRNQGTLMCHYRHRAHTDPFFYPGLQDITTHVNFSALGNTAEALGLEVIGFANQAQFLLDAGIVDIAQARWKNQPETDLAISQQLQILTAPHEMGELFKVMALGRNFSAALPGLD